MPDEHVPWEFRYLPVQYGTLELYDTWLRGGTLTADEDDYRDPENKLFWDLRGDAGRVTYLLCRLLDVCLPSEPGRSFGEDCPDASRSVAEQMELLARLGWKKVPSAPQLMRLMVRRAEEEFRRARKSYPHRKKWAYSRHEYFCGMDRDGEDDMDMEYDDELTSAYADANEMHA